MALYGRQNNSTETILTTVVGDEEVLPASPSVEIDVPLEGFPYSIYTAVISWDRDVTEFIGVGWTSGTTNQPGPEKPDEIDITVEATGVTTGNIVRAGKLEGGKATLIKSPNDPPTEGPYEGKYVYFLPIFLDAAADNRIGSGTGSATVTVKIAAGVAKYQTVNAPTAEVSKTFTFRVPTESFQNTIGGADIIYDSGEVEIDNNNWLTENFAGGSFLGVSDLAVSNGRLYAVAQIQKKRIGRENNEVSDLNQSGAVLFSVKTDGTTPDGLTNQTRSNLDNAVKPTRYPFIVSAPRSPETYNGNLYYFLGSHYVYDGLGRPVTPSGAIADTESYVRSNNGNFLFKDKIGWVINASSATVPAPPVFLNWRSKQALTNATRYDGIHGGTTSPMHVYSGDLFLYSGRSDLEQIGENPPTTAFTADDYTFPATELTDWQLIRYSEKINKRIDYIKTNNVTGWSALEQIAYLTGSVIGFNNGIFTFKSRLPISAELSASIDNTALTISYKNSTRPFPSAGSAGHEKLFIGSEIIEYSGRGETTFTIPTDGRGKYGTKDINHDVDTKITHVDHIIDATSFTKPIDELDISSDSRNLYNEIIVPYALDQQEPPSPVEKIDEESIMSNKKNSFERNADLSFQQGYWAELIASDLLRTYGKIQYLINLQLKPSPHLQLTDVVLIEEPLKIGLFRLAQVISITHNLRGVPATDVVCRTIES